MGLPVPPPPGQARRGQGRGCGEPRRTRGTEVGKGQNGLCIFLSRGGACLGTALSARGPAGAGNRRSARRLDRFGRGNNIWATPTTPKTGGGLRRLPRIPGGSASISYATTRSMPTARPWLRIWTLPASSASSPARGQLPQWDHRARNRTTPERAEDRRPAGRARSAGRPLQHYLHLN